MENQGQARPDRTLSFKRIKELTDLSRTTIWRLQRAGQFPQPIRISPGRVGWLEQDILAWQRERAAGERAKISTRLPDRSVTEPHTRAPTTGDQEVRTSPASRSGKSPRYTPPPAAQLGFEF